MNSSRVVIDHRFMSLRETELEVEVPDGDLAGGMTRASFNPRIILGGGAIPEIVAMYSGLAPGQIGIWQINFKIPDTIQSGIYTVIVLTPDGTAINDRNKLQTTISLK